MALISSFRMYNAGPVAARAWCALFERVLGDESSYMQLRFGKLPMEDSIAALETDAPDAEQIAILESGMETLVAFLAIATNVIDPSQTKS